MLFLGSSPISNQARETCVYGLKCHPCFTHCIHKKVQAVFPLDVPCINACRAQYSAERCCLVVLGGQSLDELQVGAEGRAGDASRGGGAREGRGHSGDAWGQGVHQGSTV